MSVLINSSLIESAANKMIMQNDRRLPESQLYFLTSLDDRLMVYDTQCKALVKDSIYEGKSVENVLMNIMQHQTDYRKQLGAFFNLQFFRESLTQEVHSSPDGDFLTHLVDDFGSFEKFKLKVNARLRTLKSNQCLWLILNEHDQLQITETSHYDNPLMGFVEPTGCPMLLFGFWSEADLFSHWKNKILFIENIWSLVNWEVITDRYLNLF